MRTFILRARKGWVHWDKLNLAGEEHFEVIAHSIIHAFFISNHFREDVEVYVTLDRSPNFPRTVKLSSREGLSLMGFHEQAILNLFIETLKQSQDLKKNETKKIFPGVQISGFGFEVQVKKLLKTSSLYLLDRKGEDIRTISIEENPVFVLSDHLSMPKNNIKTLRRKGVNSISVGKKMLFASQCIVLIHDELDRRE